MDPFTKGLIKEFVYSLSLIIKKNEIKSIKDERVS